MLHAFKYWRNKMRMTNWLVSFCVDIGGVEMMVHHLIRAPDMARAEADVRIMGRHWWKNLLREEERQRWQYPAGEVWLNRIMPLMDEELSFLQGLDFLYLWTVIETPDVTILQNEYGNDWREIIH